MTLSHADIGSSRELLLVGRVQGLGVRPAIAKLAARLELSGFVTNTPEGVAIHIQGPSVSVENFESLLLSALPLAAQARIDRSDSVSHREFDAFHIRKSTGIDVASGLAVEVPTDRAMCDACRRELTDPGDRRCGYAFSSCTQCGPRYSIIRTMPFDRSETTMASFGLCDSCEAEYVNGDDRRFHAQTIACPDCGPHLWFETGIAADRRSNDEALVSAAQMIQAGGIVAVKGLGGYQLICDAKNNDSVMRLRRLKHRDAKPLAVMIPTRDTMGHSMTSSELAALHSPENPIVIVDRSDTNAFAADISRGLSTVGVFLPTTPLHELLLEAANRPLVVTSGNRNADPLEYDQKRAEAALGDISDAWLHHDRQIVRPLDDSVVRIIAGRQVTIRAARGIAPLPLAIETRHRILAVGGHQKVACALSNGHQAILGPHLGDMTSLAARQRFVEQTHALQEMYGSEASVIAHDLHPDYFTTIWAAEQGCRTIAIQHHHAHVVAGMVEHGLLGQQVLGLAFDGTGYGLDRSIWGGEFLVASATEFCRVGHLLPFGLPGGETAIHEPWRVAVSLLFAAMPELTPEEIADLVNGETRIAGEDSEIPLNEIGCSDTINECHGKVLGKITPRQISGIQQLLVSGQTPQTSSLGRLFDGVASILLRTTRCSFEGELAMRLEAACQPNNSDLAGMSKSEPWTSFGLIPTAAGIQIDWRPIVRQLVADQQAGVSKSVLATRFHQAIALMAGSMADQFPELPVVLSGGCFQNRLLTERIVTTLQQRSRFVAAPGVIPPNDGGLPAGQLAIAAARLKAESQRGKL